MKIAVILLRGSCTATAVLYFMALGCSTPPPTSINTGSSWKYPNPAARYTYTDTQVDTSNGSAALKTSTTTLLYSHLDSFNGKTNVERFLEEGQNVYHYIAIQPNGDISRGDTGIWYLRDTVGTSRILWKDYPTSRLAPITVMIDSGNDGGMDIRGNFVITRSFLGMETLHLAGQDWLTYKVRDSAFLFTTTWPNWKRYDTIIYTQTWWYAPLVGNYVKMNEHMFEQDGGDYRTSTFERILTKYSP